MQLKENVAFLEVFFNLLVKVTELRLWNKKLLIFKSKFLFFFFLNQTTDFFKGQVSKENWRKIKIENLGNFKVLISLEEFYVILDGLR